MSNGLDPDQVRHSVGLDLGANSLLGLSADDKGKELKQMTQDFITTNEYNFGF